MIYNILSVKYILYYNYEHLANIQCIINIIEKFLKEEI